MARDVAVYEPKFTVVQHPGHGLLVGPARSFATMAAAGGKLQWGKSAPDVTLMTRAQIDAVIASQRAEVAAELPVGQVNGARPRQGQGVRRNNNRRVEVLKIVARSPSGMTRDQIVEVTGIKRTTTYNALLRFVKQGLLVNVEGSFPKRVMITAAGRRLI